ncbi:la autoantigen-like [Glossina fuscipes fuscipes]
MAEEVEKSAEEITKNGEKADEEENTTNGTSKPAAVLVVAEEENEDPKEVTDNLVEIGKLDKNIIRQVEYYFGDNNLSRDKFLIDQISKDEEGWVPLSVLLTFKRLAALSKDPVVIANAMMKSDEGLVEVSEDKTQLRRHPERPIPERNEERRKELMTRTAYVKGFPVDSDMNTLIDYFNAYEKVAHIYMRKYVDKPTKQYKFKGSVFVTFETKEQAENFIEKAEATYNNNKLICKWQEKYLADKREEHKAKNKKKEKKAMEKEEKGGEKIVLPKGAIVYFEGASEDVTREDIREAVEKLGDWEIAYIEFSKGEKSGNIRFSGEGIAEKFLEKLEDKKIKIKDAELELRALSEDEEKIYLAKAVEAMKNRRQLNQKNRKRRSGGHHDRNDEKKQKKTNE